MPQRKRTILSQYLLLAPAIVIFLFVFANNFVWAHSSYLLEIIYDKAFAAETIASCRTAAEEVIATFQPVASLDGP